MCHYEIPELDAYKTTEPDPEPTSRFGVDVIMNITVNAVDRDHARQLAEEIANGIAKKDVDYISIAGILLQGKTRCDG